MQQRRQARRPVRRRRAARSAPALLAALAAAVLAAALLPAPAAAQVLPMDKQALLEFKAGLTEQGGELLNDWVPESDPCDGWTGVRCTCRDFRVGPDDTSRARVCQQPDTIPDGSRVLQLNFGDPQITDWNVLTGTIAPELANLTALRVLNLNLNRLYGSIPKDLARLTSLEQLLLGGNRLTGSVPAYLSTFPELRYVRLDNNQFEGPLPYEWCNGSWWQFDVQNNAGLCSEVPQCLRERILSFAGTSLIDNVNDQDQDVGGYCNVDPPTCQPEQGCRILRPDPPYFTNATTLSFAFTTFSSLSDNGTIFGGPIDYRWAIGTTRWGRDVLDWVKFAGTNATEAVELPSGATVRKLVFSVEYTLNQVSLTPGAQYYITVQAWNDAGQVLGTLLSSEPIVADTSPPYLPDGSSVYSGQDFSNQASQSETQALAASFDPFVDDETGIDYYSYQVFQFVGQQSGDPGYVGAPITNKTRLDFQPGQGDYRVYIVNLDLARGGSYFMRIYATNGAGLEGYRDAPPVAISTGSTSSSSAVSVSKVVILVAVFVGAASAFVGLVTYWLMRESMRRHQAARKLRRGQMKNFKYLMQSLVQQVGDADRRQLDELKQLQELAFVITDLENSTAIASGAPRQFEKVQEMHDSLIRELIGRFHGYEINTEGDAFHVAFKDVQAAVLFCMEVQYQMLELEWPREVLRLGPCKEVKAPDGSLAYRGPRIRMGVHWAVEGTVVQRLHQITKHRVFTGPAFQVTRELCEAAHGGQVLLSHEGWVRLRQGMASASFPVVEQLGQFMVDSWPAPIWIYQVTQLLGRPLHRQPGPPNGLEALEAGWGMSITQPPAPRGPKGHLAFVAVRLALECCPAGNSAGEANPAISKRLHELLATVAMQFGGYIFRLSESQGAYLLAFGLAVDAVRFCHSAQALLMYSQWPADCAEYCGKTELAPDGKPVFKGPRVAMAVHQSCEFTTISVPRQQAAADDVTTDYLGTAVERVQQLSEAAHGGQVIVSEKAWAAVQDQLPGQPHVVSLGSHILDHSPASHPLLLMEVMPQVLSRRTFEPPRTIGMVEPGYRDAPAADESVAFVYVKVAKPVEVQDAEQVKLSISEDTIMRVMTAYTMAVSKATKLMRQLLRQYRGYECKEPEPGKLTLAFRQLEDALQWGCALQQELLGFAWPESVLEWGECCEVREAESTNLLWRGLRVKIGISYGVPSSKAPLNTGRADYFGSVPNLAARLMAVAQPGQILVDGRLNSLQALQWREDGGAMMVSQDLGLIEFTPLGYLQVKGLDEPKLVFQVLPARLRARQYDDLPTTGRTHSVSAHNSARLGSMGGSSGRTLASGGLSIRRAASDWVSAEGTPRQGSATSVRTPSIKRGLQGASTRAGRMRTALLSHREESVLGSRRNSTDLGLGDDGLQPYHPGSEVPGPDMRSFSVASSGGSFARSGWLGVLGQRLTGALRRAPHSVNPSEMGSPRSAHDVLPLTSRSGTTAGTSQPSFTVPGAQPIPMPGSSAVGILPHRSSSVTGVLPPGLPVIASGVGSYASDSALANVLSTVPASNASTPHAGVRSGHNSPPLTASRLRDAIDWSYPGSTLTTPTTQQAGGSQVDHWEAGLAMEAALGHEAAAAAQAASGMPRQHQPAVTARQLSGTGLPPRRPPAPRSHTGITLEAAFAAASSGSTPLGSGGGGGGLSRTRSDPTSSASAAAEFATSLRDGSRFSALAAVAAAASGERHLPHVEAEMQQEAGSLSAARSVAGGSDSGSIAGSREHSSTQLPPWQSPARIPPIHQSVPPLPLGRLGGHSGGGSGASSTRGGAGELDLLPPPAAAPAGLVPPGPQLAVSSSVSRASSAASLVLAPNGPSLVPGSLIGGGGSGEVQPPGGSAGGGSGGRGTAQPPQNSARRPAGLAVLDTDSLTFETFGLESPDTITPGLQYARQVAQLFVEGRRRSGTLSAALTAASSTGSLSSSLPSRLGQVPPISAPLARMSIPDDSSGLDDSSADGGSGAGTSPSLHGEASLRISAELDRHG